MKLLSIITIFFMSISSKAQSLSALDVSLDADGYANILIGMNGVDGYASSGFIVTLPSGFTISEYSGAVDEHEVTMNTLTSNSMKIAVYSLSNMTFANNENEIINIKIKADGINSGSYQGIISSIEFASAVAKLTKASNVFFNIIVPETEYSPGDANGDGVITVADYIAIAHYIMNNPPSGFNEKAADANGDGQINVADYIAVAHIIMNSNNQ